MSAATFVAAVKSVALAADSKAGLPFDHVSVSIGDCGGVEFAATDRYRLAVASSVDHVSEPVSVALLPVKELVSFTRSVKVPARGPVDLVTFSFGTDVVSIMFGGSSVSWKRSDLPDVDRFPSYRKLLVMPDPVSGVNVSNWNPQFLADGAEACGLMGKKNTGVRFSLFVPDKPALLEPVEPLEGMRFSYLIMPVRIRG
jgi:DNA polymerase III sliding clamp (beta) subunit (PCNA family)